jgi:hypothetical protein
MRLREAQNVPSPRKRGEGETHVQNLAKAVP